MQKIQVQNLLPGLPVNRTLALNFLFSSSTVEYR